MSECISRNEGQPVNGQTLPGKISKLLKGELARPVYFRVAPGSNGEPVIEQVAFLRSEQLAELIGFDDRTIRGWATAGKIPCFKPPTSNVYLFDLNEVLRWIKTGWTTEAPTP